MLHQYEREVHGRSVFKHRCILGPFTTPGLIWPRRISHTKRRDWIAGTSAPCRTATKTMLDSLGRRNTMLDSAGRGGTMSEAAGTRALSDWYSVCRAIAYSASPACAFNVKGSGSESASVEQRKTWASHWSASSTSSCSLSPFISSHSGICRTPQQPVLLRCIPHVWPQALEPARVPRVDQDRQQCAEPRRVLPARQRAHGLLPDDGHRQDVDGPPTQGKTQMFRRDLSESSFANVLDNPRSHTGHGYQRK
jgi:hypothetical protein